VTSAAPTLSTACGSDGLLQGAQVLRDINRVRPQYGQVDHLQGMGVGAGQHYRWSNARLVCLSPPFSNHTPPIPRLQTRKAVLGHRRDQVIPDAALMIKKFCCQHCTHQMAGLRGSGAAAAVAIKAGKRISAAGLQFSTEDIRFTIHSPSLAETGVS
jgi:hypothetical protein